MKNIAAIIVVGIVIIGGAIFGANHFLAKPDYEAVTKFAYSTDDGYSYREGVQVVKVGERYYLSVEMQVAVSKDPRSETVTATITLPNVNIVDAFLFDNPGEGLTGTLDDINDVITYEIKVPTSTNPLKVRAIFEFIPLDEGLFQITLNYDDNVAPEYDRTETIRFEIEESSAE